MPEQKVPTKAARAFAMTAATGAVACAACCVLPFALPAVALAGFGSMLALLAGALAWVTTFAVVVVAGAWMWVAWQSLRSEAPPARSTLYMMGGATALTAIATMWPQIELVLIRVLLR
jgi:hypothetical protein